MTYEQRELLKATEASFFSNAALYPSEKNSKKDEYYYYRAVDLRVQDVMKRGFILLHRARCSSSLLIWLGTSLCRLGSLAYLF